MRLRFMAPALFLMALTFVNVRVFAAPMIFRAHEDARDEVSFVSKAPLEKIVGRANKTRAEIMVEKMDDLMKGKTSATFEIDLDSIKTGIDLRDQHMRDQFLEVNKYPKATFTLTKIVSVQVVEKDYKGNNAARGVKGLSPNAPTRLIADGTFEIHGVKKPLRLSDLTVTYVPESDATKNVRKGSLLHIEGSFGVKLSDYGIERPQMLVLRLADDAVVNLDMTVGTGEGTSGGMNAGGSCGGKCGGKKTCDDKKACGGKKGCGEKSGGKK